MQTAPAPVPGMTIRTGILVRRGLLTLLVLIVVAASTYGLHALLSHPQKNLTLVVRSVAPGVVPGTAVDMDGLTIGEVSGISEDGPGKLALALTLNGTADDLVTDAVTVAFAPGNTFGITVVSLTPGRNGRALQSGASWEPLSAPDDATMSSLITTLSMVEREGFRPHMGEVLSQMDSVTKQFLPLVGALGSIAQANAETQVIPTAQSLPTLATILANLDTSTARILPALKTLWDWRGPDTPGYPQRQTATIDTFVHELTPAAAALLSEPNSAALAETLAPLGLLTQRLTASMPNAALNGRQIETLLEKVRRSLPNTGSGPVLNLDLTLARYPAIAPALPPAPAAPTTPTTPTTPGGR